LVLMGVSLSTQTPFCTESHVCVKQFVETYGTLGTLRYELQGQSTVSTQLLRRLDEILAMLKKAQNAEISNDMHPRTCIMCRELPNVTMELRQYRSNTLSRDLENVIENLYKQLSSVILPSKLETNNS